MSINMLLLTQRTLHLYSVSTYFAVPIYINRNCLVKHILFLNLYIHYNMTIIKHYINNRWNGISTEAIRFMMSSPKTL